MQTPSAAARRHLPRISVPSVLAASVLASVLAVGAGAASPAPVSAAVPATWYGAEVYYLGLVNCTRTGGWVRADGSCDGYGSGRYSRYVAPLRLNATLSNVARRWAKHLSVNNECRHGDPGARIHNAGFRPSTWGENVGCFNRMTDVRAAVLAVHRMMQAEKSSNGGHWKNMKNGSFHRIGIGIWKDHGRVRVVNDFIS